MDSFREYIQNHDSKHGHFMDYWRSLKSNEPLYMEPIAKDHVGTTKAEDTIRVSGGPKFIATVMARLKDLLTLENDRTKLDVTFRKSEYLKQDGEKSYILYVNLKGR
jgi:hypothetical protein